ncbi:hypothetical protein GCWU000324_02805 [Kingella oralis ATCC 51147]|uniref:Uncharacterized protein n=1 Tax=Kingella oralis ATCC 51147 TaxID=629741 RepID=C4GM72_9NEIS|nr:hypothetical protein GCWU000324_02805 [Kingella oralis ATCC 51147]
MRYHTAQTPLCSQEFPCPFYPKNSAWSAAACDATAKCCYYPKIEHQRQPETAHPVFKLPQPSQP